MNPKSSSLAIFIDSNGDPKSLIPLLQGLSSNYTGTIIIQQNENLIECSELASHIELPLVQVCKMEPLKKGTIYIGKDFSKLEVKNDQVRVCSDSNEFEEAVLGNDFLSKINDVSPGIIAVYNHTTSSVEYSNRNILNSLGYSSKELKEMKEEVIQRLIHPDDLKLVGEHFEKIRKSDFGDILTVEYRILHKDGTYRWFLAKNTLVKEVSPDEDIKHIGFTFEISDIKNVRFELSQRNMFLTKVMDIIPSIVYIFNQQTNSNEFANKEIYELLGYSECDVQEMGANFMEEIFLEEEFPSILNHFEKIANSNEGEFFELEYRAKCKDGSIKWLYSIDTVFEKTENGAVKHIGVATDITKIKASELELRKSYDLLEQRVEERTKDLRKINRKYNDLYNLAPDMFASVSAVDATVVECNNTLLNRLELSREEVIGSSVFDLYHPDCIENVHKVFHQFQSSGKVENEELILGKKDGEKIHVILNVDCVRDEKGKIIHSISAWRDVSELREIQSLNDKLQANFRANLISEVNQRTQELNLAKDELIIALNKEKELGELKSRFVANASHQFRTPLTVIKMNFDLLNQYQNQHGESDSNKVIVKIRSRIDEEINKMTNLMDDVLLLGKINSGAKKAIFSEVDIEAICSKIAHKENALHSDLKLDFEVFGSETSMINSDNKLFDHAFSNVVSNAFKYASEDSTVTVNLYLEKENVIIKVIDQGIGIPAEDLPRLFEPFFRSDNAIHKEGTGLGMSIAKEYFDLIGADFSVKSEERIGTECTIILPRD